jgi:hypothetical protein
VTVRGEVSLQVVAELQTGVVCSNVDAHCVPRSWRIR